MKILEKLKHDRSELINSLCENIASLEKVAYEQQAKIEALKVDKNQLEIDIVNERMNLEKVEQQLTEIIDLCQEQKEEIERLNIRNKALIAIAKNYDWKFAKAKSEAYKEFAERLHQNCEKYPYTLPYVLANIEITYKELTEGGNEDGISKITNE